MRAIHQIIVIVLIAVPFFFFLDISVHAQTSEPEWTSDQWSAISFTEIQQYWTKVVEDYGGYLPELQKGSFAEFMKNHDAVSIQGWVGGLLKFFFYELVMNGKLLGTLVFLTLFSMILQSLQNAFEQQAVSKVAYAIVYMVLIMLALNSFYLAVSYAKDAIEMMSSFMVALLPLMLGLMATFGNVMAVSFFHPVILFLIHSSGVLISTIILPLLFLSALLSIVSSINEEYKVTQLAQLLRNGAMGILGAFLTIFLGVISVQGATTAITDGVAMKTTKFVTGNFVPVVGRMFTDATDTVLSASLLLKNTVGIVGVVLILALALFPAIKVLAIALIYKIAAAVLQPVGGAPIISSMDIIAKHILFIFAALLVVTFMFFLTIVLLVVTSNVTMMIR
ncbi:stage III sporulation protein AE [Pontibacillus litoralis]|uniref:Stage III sporulation protein AE n=1 Tax=Pontibacillus litoralis JSM 072002 TaxID=1385512 RepID=A0A0A5GCK6_9BACI|nr:stage III sporulation protein AE [Pontibacillus litoralis]KGX88845.1 stage III sporulation protein AE [Pontibacillus litoralis JSM 072002]